LTVGDAPRYDLGTLELLFTMALSVVLIITWRRKLPEGSYVALVALTYAPARFAMDFLRAHDGHRVDARYASLTPAQWACVARAGLGVAMVARLRSAPRKSASPPAAACSVVEVAPNSVHQAGR